MNDYDISSIFKDMELYLIDSMSRNMKRHTNWEDKEEFQWNMWQAKQLESLNGYRKSNTTYVNKQTNLIKLKIEELLKQSNEHGGMQEEIKILNAIKKGFKPGRTPKGIEGSFFKVNDRKLKALIDATTKDVQKSTTSMLRMANDEYRKTIFKSQVFANTGTMTVDQSIDLATKDFLSKGINCIEYSNGNRVNIASWAEMAIKTSNKRAYLQGEGSKRAEWGIHTVLISQYGACSPICLPLQGKVYIDDVWSGGTAEEAESTGYGLLSVAITAGLFHPNCKHTMTTYFEGITKIPFQMDVDKTNENSNIIATQRYNERQIRMYKRLEKGSLDSSNKERYKRKVKEWQQRNNELVKKHPEMHRSYKREGLRGVNRVDTTVDEVSSVLESADIPKFMKKSSKQRIHNTDEEILTYMKLANIKTKNPKVIDIIKNDMRLMPKRDLDLLREFKVDISEQVEGPSQYRKTKIKLLPIQSSIKINKNARSGTFAHEFAHFASDKLNLYQNDEFLDALENSTKGAKLVEAEFNGVMNMAMESKCFVSKYQGRIYMTPDEYAKFKVIKSKDLKEYMSVGYETYIFNPDLLYEKDKMLYDFLERRGFKNEK